MYICKEHGQKKNDWCDECKKLLFCNCKNIITTRFKDLIYDCEDGERTVIIYLYHCETCGEVVDIK